MDKIEGTWDRFSKLYDRVSDCSSVSTLQLWNMLRVREADSILECGCGPGFLLPFLVEVKKSDAFVWAFDLSGEMVRMALERLKKLEK